MQSTLAARREKARPLYKTALSVTTTAKRADSPYAIPLQVAHMHALMGEPIAAREAITLTKKEAAANPRQRDEALPPLVTVQLQMGDRAGAQVTAAGIPDPEKRTSALIEIAVAERKAGDKAGASRTLTQARTIAAAAPAAVRPAALTNVAVAQLEAGDKAGLRATVPLLARAAAAVPAPAERAGHLGTVAGLQAKLGDRAISQATFKRAIRDAETALSRAKDPNNDVPYVAMTLCNLATLQAGAEDKVGARATFVRTRKAIDRVQSLVYRATYRATLALAEVDAGEAEAARADFVAADEFAARCTGPTQQCGAFIEVAGFRGKAGDRSGQRASLLKAKRAASRNPDAIAAALDLMLVGVEQAETGDFAGARETAGGITEGEYRCLVLIAVGKGQAKTGDRGGALKTLGTLASLCEDEEALSKLSDAYAWAGDADAVARVSDDAVDPYTTFVALYEAVCVLVDPESPPFRTPLSGLGVPNRRPRSGIEGGVGNGRGGIPD